MLEKNELDVIQAVVEEAKIEIQKERKKEGGNSNEKGVRFSL